ncbi:nuclear transport factor 2 family protein [Nakamurella flava]|uniref:Nuclear transport factor 2 family protein n=1 Tax=Nakamurella flava TaxID=2576308 RepID=A0A4V6CT49_9ACTN|nr:nuclear transport factor 2 family protein [Nakamurella flava]TKV57665.1 nuclear transport factor 2 family protein [Nakamurella flava]
MTTSDERTALTVETYFAAWQTRDFARLSTVLAEDVDFVGAMGAAQGPQDCLAGLRGVRDLIDDIHVVRRWVDGPDAITWFELRRDDHHPIPTVNWSHVGGDGRIDRIRVTFDPRPLLG